MLSDCLKNKKNYVKKKKKVLEISAYFHNLTLVILHRIDEVLHVMYEACDFLFT